MAIIFADAWSKNCYLTSCHWKAHTVSSQHSSCVSYHNSLQPFITNTYLGKKKPKNKQQNKQVISLVFSDRDVNVGKLKTAPLSRTFWTLVFSHAQLPVGAG